MNLSILIINILLLLNILFIVAVLFAERKNPASSIAWILFLVFVPIIGMLAYLFVGTGFHVNKRKKFAFKAAADALVTHYLATELSLRNTLFFMQNNERLTRMVSFLRNAGEGIYTDDNTVEVFTFGGKAFAAMLDDLRNAQKHIHLLYYIIRNDDLGREVLSILTQKAKEGVEVRLIYDSVGSFRASTYFFQELVDAGGHVQAFSPMRFFGLSQFRLNYRNHRKITVVDGAIGYVGGMNIVDEYRQQPRKSHFWRDTHLRITGMAVWFLQERFLMDWCYATDQEFKALEVSTYFPAPVERGSLGIQIVSSGPDTEESPIKGGLMEMLYAAKGNVYIQTPYFTPDETFLSAMCNAARAGVDVRLMIPAKGDHWVVHLATMNFARQVIAAGVRVYAYDGFLHAKTVVFDSLAASIGTCNIGYRSFTLNFEVTAFIYNTRFAAEQEQTFLHDLESCIELDESWFAKQHLIKRSLYSASRLVAPLM